MMDAISKPAINNPHRTNIFYRSRPIRIQTKKLIWPFGTS
ncbi:hypothetical protein FOXB_10953 [Fusarium oxysporum f. sp. conglutinans Fo5176]|uniref:Uncharacterized protein n=1 Tax=Fusarium oxysporum (strain Fo5176) TaxID=660025 RepID=F9FX21_FUSOF|nr:hypothetical protein FOXB_10953 [Fusarium oxysporum f. sp. conglutinans Fo5176]